MLRGRFEKLAVKGLLWIVIVFFIGVTVLLAGAAWEVRQKQKIAFREREYAKEQFEETSERLETLLQNVENISNERGIEEEFRRRFPVAREGEEVIVLVDAKDSTIDTTIEANGGFWNVLKRWFGF